MAKSAAQFDIVFSRRAAQMPATTGFDRDGKNYTGEREGGGPKGDSGHRPPPCIVLATQFRRPSDLPCFTGASETVCAVLTQDAL